MIDKKGIILTYLKNLDKANTETAKKELFKTLLTRLFDDPASQEIIDKMSLGAEKKLVNSDSGSYFKADTQYNQVIIEFKKNLSQSEQTTRQQLEDYLKANCSSGNVYNFVLIATDCKNWKVYSPSYEILIESNTITLEECDKFSLTEKNVDSFPQFLDRYNILPRKPLCLHSG